MVVRAFTEACRNGDIAALAAVLDPDVVLRSDGGGVVVAARRPVFGVSNVSRFLLGVLAKYPQLEVFECETADGISLAFRNEGRVSGVVSLNVVDDVVVDVWIVMNPDKLTLWNTPSA